MTVDDLRRFDSFGHLERLLAEYDRYKATALSLTTPNVEDDYPIRCGMVGFSRHLSLDRWDVDHLRYVRALYDDVAGPAFGDDWRQFTCLAGGYFLGMWAAGLIGDVELRLTEGQTPGFMWLNSPRFDCGDTPDRFQERA